MKIEKMNFSEKKIGKGFLYGFIVCAILTVVINLVTSRAKYKTTESINIAKGTVNFTPYDLKAIAMYKNDGSGYVETTTMPGSNYVINQTESYCTVGTSTTKDTSIVLKTVDGRHTISNLQKLSKCYLYFDLSYTCSGWMCEHLNTTKSVIAMPEITGVETANTTGKVYSVADDLGTSYVFRGAPTDNWVSFGGFYWRIIRMNGDGSTRMIYAGTSTSTTGTDDQLASTSNYNSTGTDNAYEGYMYGTAGSTTYAATHANTNNSTIKGAVDEWYNTNLNKTGVAEYIDGNIGFCNDRSMNVGSEVWNSSDTKLGYGTNATHYGAYGRMFLNGSWRSTALPSLKCPNASNDLFTTSGSSQGNKALTYPVGLITVDEVVLAGGFGGTANSSYYLKTGQMYWTMSPSYFSGSIAGVFRVDDGGGLYNNSVNFARGVRPVINLKADTTFSGSGTTSNPYSPV